MMSLAANSKTSNFRRARALRGARARSAAGALSAHSHEVEIP